MPIQYIFWGLMIVWFFFGGVLGGYYAGPNWRGFAGGFLLQWVVVAILGWKAFGPMVQR